jgi:hypothetical protein
MSALGSLPLLPPPFLAGTHCLLRYRPSGRRHTWKSVVASYFVYIHRAESPEILSFAFAAISGSHSFASSDIDLVIAKAPGN